MRARRDAEASGTSGPGHELVWVARSSTVGWLWPTACGAGLCLLLAVLLVSRAADPGSSAVVLVVLGLAVALCVAATIRTGVRGWREGC